MQLLSIDVDGNGDIEETTVKNVNYDSQAATALVPDEANTTALSGKCYADISDLSLALFTFGADGSFREVIQRVRDGGVEVGENVGAWNVDADGTIGLDFPPDATSNDKVTSGGALVTGGLGEEEMTIEILGGSEGTSVVNLIRVEAFEQGEVIGSWFELGADGVATTSLSFDRDGSGVLEDRFGAGAFEWTVAEDGCLQVTSAPHDHVAGRMESVTLHKLANSEGEMLSVVLVFRRNGKLDFDVEVGPNRTPRNAVDSFMLFRAF